MISMKRPVMGLVAAAAVLSMTGCGTSMMQVKDINANKADYVATHFKLENLPKTVAAQVPRNTPKLSFNKLVFALDATTEETDGKKDVWKNVLTMERLSDDLIRLTREQSSNDIPVNASYGISYRGIQDLRWQSVPVQAQLTSHTYEVKELKRLDVLPTAVGQTFTSDYATGTVIQLMNFASFQRNCKATKQVPASEYHKSLTGQVTELDCQTLRDNVVQNRSKWAVFQQYGVAMMMEIVNTSSKTTYRIAEVTIQP